MLGEGRQDKHHTQGKGPASANQNCRPHITAHDGLVTAFGLLLHIAPQSRFAAERQGCQGIHHQVYPQNLGDGERVLNTNQGTDKADQHRRHVDGKLEYNKLPDAVKDGAAIENRLFNGTEIIVQNHNLAGFLCNFRTAAHGKAHVRLFQRRGVVHAVAGHAYHQIQLLGHPDETALVTGKRPGYHTDTGQLVL